MPHHIHRNGLLSQGAQFCSTGRGNPSTPVTLTPSHWWWRGAPTAPPPSAWYFPFGRRTPWMGWTGPPPVPSTQTQCAANGSPSFPLSLREHDTWPKLSRPTKRCDKVSYDDKGHCLVGSESQSRSRDSDTILNGWNTSDWYHRGIG